MGWNGSGVFNRLYSWVQDFQNGLDINATRMDADTDDITSNGFGNCITRDGQWLRRRKSPFLWGRHSAPAAQPHLMLAAI